jgi:hypothetical protein
MFTRCRVTRAVPNVRPVVEAFERDREEPDVARCPELGAALTQGVTSITMSASVCVDPNLGGDQMTHGWQVVGPIGLPRQSSRRWVPDRGLRQGFGRVHANRSRVDLLDPVAVHEPLHTARPATRPCRLPK